MSQLQDNLNEILRQKNQVLIPANVKVGTQYLGQTGAYTSDANAVAADILSGKTAYVNGVKLTGTHVDGHDNVKMFSSVAAMNADADKALGDIAIVLDTTTGVTRKVQENDIFHKLYIPNSITFTASTIPSYVKDFIDNSESGDEQMYACGFWVVNSSVVRSGLQEVTQTGDWYPGANCLITLCNNDGTFDGMLDFQSMEDGVMHYDLRSSDGYTWTHSGNALTWDTMTNKGVYVKLGPSQGYGITEPMTHWQQCTDFLQAIFDNMLGVYQVKNYRTAYDSVSGEYTTELRYCPLETQLTPIAAGDVYENKVVMGNNNTIVTGTLEVNQTEVNTAVDTTENILGEPEIPDPVNEGPGEGDLED